MNRTLAFLVAIVANALVGFCNAQVPSLPFYGGLSPSQAQEIEAWNQHFWHRIETGTPSENAATFSFSDASLASPLFQPQRAAKQTLEKLDIIASSECLWYTSTDHDSIIVLTEYSATESLRDYMMYGKLSTDLADNYDGTVEHLNRILSTAVGVDWQITDGQLISYGLSPYAIGGNFSQGQYQYDISESSLDAIGIIVGSSTALAEGAEQPSEALRSIRGGFSRTDEFVNQLGLLLSYSYANQVVVSKMDAVFGAFGVLPLMVVQLEDCYVLVDTINGNIDGPFLPTSPFDATSLLSYHDEYKANTGIEYVDDKGCETTVPTPPPAQIRVRCRPIGTIPGTPAVHCWFELETYGPNGELKVCGAHPQYPTWPDTPITNPLQNWPWGTLKGVCGLWGTTPDSSIPGVNNDPFDQGDRTTMISCPDKINVSDVYACIARVMARISECDIRYSPTQGPNSNTALRVAFDICGKGAGCKLIMVPDGRPRTGGGRLPVGWDSEEGADAISNCVEGAQPPISPPTPQPPSNN